MTLKYTATLEFQADRPLTTSGEVSASAMPTCMRLAAKQAMLAFPRRQWSSVVIVLERKEGA